MSSLSPLLMSVSSSPETEIRKLAATVEDVNGNFLPSDHVTSSWPLFNLSDSVSDDDADSPSTPEIVTFSVVMSVCIAVTIVGNILVIMSVFTYRPLRGVQNFYIVSLAVADLAVAILVMPFNVVYYALRGRWLFGVVFCHVWLTADILTCTASILNLCAIALDRYRAIHDPIGYAQSRTVGRVLLSVGAVWTASALISVPPLIGWNRGDDSLYNPTTARCQLTDHPSFVVYSASGSFYIPLAVMTFVYVKIFLATRRRLRTRARTYAATAASFVTSYPAPTGGEPAIGSSGGGVSGSQININRTTPMATVALTTSEVPENQSCVHDCSASSIEGDYDDDDNETALADDCAFGPDMVGLVHRQQNTVDVQQHELTLATVSISSYQTESATQSESALTDVSMAMPSPTDQRQPLDVQRLTTAETVDEVVKLLPSVPDSHSNAGQCQPDSCRCHSSLFRRHYHSKKQRAPWNIRRLDKIERLTVDDRGNPRLLRPPPFVTGNGCRRGRTLKVPQDDAASDGVPNNSKADDGGTVSTAVGRVLVEKQRHSAAKERRLARTMAVIMAAFVVCWLPFFVMYVTFPFCARCVEMTDERAVTFIVWLGYINSTLNPVIYTVFNVDFRRAFKSLLTPGQRTSAVVR